MLASTIVFEGRKKLRATAACAQRLSTSKACASRYAVQRLWATAVVAAASSILTPAMAPSGDRVLFPCKPAEAATPPRFERALAGSLVRMASRPVDSECHRETGELSQ